MALDDATRRHLDRCRDDLPPDVGESDVVFGFDGVMDRVRTVVRERTGPAEYESMTGVEEFGTRITDSAALDASCSLEWLTDDVRPGGHVSHLGRAFERLGFAPTLVGTFGDPPAAPFREEYDRADLVSVGEPSTTDAIEFGDGKVMLSETGKLATMDWTHLEEALGRDALAAHLDGADALGVGYWSTIPRLPAILEGLAEDLWPSLDDPPARAIVDPADVRRLSASARRGGLDAMGALDDRMPVTVSANHPESVELARMSGARVDGDSLVDVAEAVHECIEVERFVAHSASTAVAVTDEGTDVVAVPRCAEPAMTTSAGDHFNAGLLLADLLGVDRGAALVVASSLAGFFVRNAAPPSYEELVAFVETYDERGDSPEGGAGTRQP